MKKILINIFEEGKIEKEKNNFFKNGQIPWSEGYDNYKKKYIHKSLNDNNLLNQFKEMNLPSNYGYRIDERVVEYPWLFSRIINSNQEILDAGSTFNFDFIVSHKKIKENNLTIYTFAPEFKSHNSEHISYVYGDLRNLPFKNELFDIVVSHSTIEHIDMDNSLYGYDLPYNRNVNDKSYEYIIAVKEMIRVLRKGGNLLLTFPYGKFENHGFFQQFDEEMLSRITYLFKNIGLFESCFFKYEEEGWRFAVQEDLLNSESHNPHTGKGKKKDNAAHSRGIACLSFIKSV